MLLTEAQALIRDTAREFARARLAPGAAARDRESRFPQAEIAEMGALGFMGMLVPEDWGGAGADHLAYAIALEEIAAADGACSTIMSVHNSVACMPLLRFGSAAQKDRFLGPLARGEMLGCFCLTEPQAGSDAAALATRARRATGGWILDGTKQFITSGSRADLAIVFAVTDPAKGKRGISAFLVPTASPGWRVARIEEKLGQRSSDTAQIVLDGLRVPDDMMLGGEGEGYRIALANLEGGRIGIAAQAVGFRLADMATRIAAARLLVHDAARRRDAGLPCLTEASMAKLFASEIAEQVCTDAIQIHGGYGYLSDFPVERIYRDVRVCQIYEGTSDIQRLVIARALVQG